MYNNTYYNDTQYNSTHYNNTQYNNTQYDDTTTLSITRLIITNLSLTNLIVISPRTKTLSITHTKHIETQNNGLTLWNTARMAVNIYGLYHLLYGIINAKYKL
jgi:hypothetical protein